MAMDPKSAFNAGLGDVGLGGFTDSDHDYDQRPTPSNAMPAPENALDYTNPDA